MRSQVLEDLKQAISARQDALRTVLGEGRTVQSQAATIKTMKVDARRKAVDGVLAPAYAAALALLSAATRSHSS